MGGGLCGAGVPKGDGGGVWEVGGAHWGVLGGGGVPGRVGVRVPWVGGGRDIPGVLGKGGWVLFGFGGSWRGIWGLGGFHWDWGGGVRASQDS